MNVNANRNEEDNNEENEESDNEDNREEAESGNDVNESEVAEKSDEDEETFNIENITVGEYYIVKFITAEDHRTRLCIGRVESFNRPSVTLKFLQRRYGSFFSFPVIDDIYSVKPADIIRQVRVHTNRRGLITFSDEVTDVR